MADEKKQKGEGGGAGGAKSGAGKGGGKKKDKGGAAASAPHSQRSLESTTEAVAPRLAEKYRADVVPALTKQFGYKNPMQVPRLAKIVVNMGLGAAVANPKIIDTAVEEIRALGGQKPIVTRSKKAIANFKLRAGLPIGAMVT